MAVGRFLWFFTAVALFLSALLVGGGCSYEEPIETYKVPKDTAIERLMAAKQEPARTLAAMIEGDLQTWFFKITGPDAEVKTKRADFEQFLKSVTFQRELKEQPKWTLPAGWKLIPGPAAGSLRFASIEIPTSEDERPLTLAVTSLGGEQDALANVNRWRNQLSLPPIEAKDLSGDVAWLTAGKRKVMVTELVGTAPLEEEAAAAHHGRFATGRRNAGRRCDCAESPAVAGSPIKYELPKGWRVSNLKIDISLATFEVENEKGRGVVTISLAGGEDLANVNRCATRSAWVRSRRTSLTARRS